jgi:hypothetical protein
VLIRSQQVPGCSDYLTVRRGAVRVRDALSLCLRTDEAMSAGQSCVVADVSVQLHVCIASVMEMRPLNRSRSRISRAQARGHRVQSDHTVCYGSPSRRCRECRETRARCNTAGEFASCPRELEQAPRTRGDVFHERSNLCAAPSAYQPPPRRARRRTKK